MSLVMNNEKSQFPSPEPNSLTRLSRVKEAVLTLLLGQIRRPVGTIMRKLLYPKMFGWLGKSVYIQTGCEFIGASCIEIGNNVKILRDVRLNACEENSKIRIGSNVCLDRGVDINVVPHEGNCHIEIGEGTHISPYTCLAGPGNIKIGKKCLIASYVGIYANNHNFADPSRYIWNQGVTRKGIVIEDDCWLGAGVKVLDGVTIGQGSVIGAGAVVTKDIPPYSVAVGVPAKVIQKRNSNSDNSEKVPLL